MLSYASVPAENIRVKTPPNHVHPLCNVNIYAKQEVCIQLLHLLYYYKKIFFTQTKPFIVHVLAWKA